MYHSVNMRRTCTHHATFFTQSSLVSGGARAVAAPGLALRGRLYEGSGAHVCCSVSIVIGRAHRSIQSAATQQAKQTKIVMD